MASFCSVVTLFNPDTRPCNPDTHPIQPRHSPMQPHPPIQVPERAGPVQRVAADRLAVPRRHVPGAAEAQYTLGTASFGRSYSVGLRYNF